MRILGLDHLVLTVRDMEAALLFYHETLGLPLERLEEFRRGEAPFPSVLVAPDTVLDLIAGPRPNDARNVDHFCLLIEPTDMEALAAELRAGGVEVVGKVSMRWGALGDGVPPSISRTRRGTP